MNLTYLSIFVVWAALTAAGGIFFWFHRNAALKRKLFPWYVIGGGGFFAGIAIWQTGGRMAFLLVPAVAVIAWLNIRNTRWCDQCGRMSAPRSALRPEEFCARCGASLENKLVEKQDKDRIGTFH